MRIDPEIVGVDIVLLGDFNPAIFSPRWFSSNGLIRETAADGADLRVVHQEVADFTADWLRIQVTRDRFAAASLQAPFARLRDLVHGVFGECLYHTPVRAFGINYSVHFLVYSSAMRDRLGTTLVPLEPWGRLGDRLNFDGRHGGMTSLRISQLKPEDRDEGGQINVTVEPSKRVGINSGKGVFVAVNDHFAGDGDTERLMETLADQFGPSLERAAQTVDHIMSLTQAGR